MARKRRKKQHGDHENHERWLVTYSDLITLLLVFFIVLYSMSELEKERFNALVQSLRTAFQGEAIVDQSVDPPARDITAPPIPEQKKDEKNEQKLDALYIQLQKYIKDNGLDTQLELNNLPQGVQITLKEEILFDLGKADIKPQAIPILERVGGILKSVKNPISVEGHTDNNPIRYSREFHSNWDLAAARAENVAMFLMNKDGINGARIRFTSYGEFNPRVANDTKEHQAMNRRVNIVVLRDQPVTK
ncbi:MAG: flagellar motor protein MotB [Tuberibacillus sp.]